MNEKNEYSVIITGAGSVMGQSIYKALANSNSAGLINLIYLNSLDINAGFNFESTLSKFKSQNNLICPLASDKDSYLSFIRNLIEEFDVDIIYPGTQHELDVLSILNDSIGLVACPDNKTARNCLDKANTTEILELNDIPTPRSIRVIDGDIGNGETPEFYPVILKPNSSSASRNVFKCDDSQSLLTSLNEYKKLGIKEAVVQTYLDGLEYTCGVYLDKYSQKISTIIFERILSEDGASLYGVVIEDKEIEDYLHLVTKAFIKESNFEFGHINIQLRNTTQGPMLFEINGRLSSTEAPKSMLGFNSVEAYFYNIVLQSPYDAFLPSFGKKFIRYYEEIYF